MKRQWCYSFNNKDFSSGAFCTKKLALEEAQKEGFALNNSDDSSTIKFIYIAQCEVAKNHSFFPDAEILIEHMACQADDIGGEHANGYPDASHDAEKELTNELHKLLHNWCNKHCISPTFYTVFESIKFDLNTLAKV